MSKISEEDLKKIFGLNKDQFEFSPNRTEEGVVVQKEIKYKKTDKKVEEIEIKKIKKQIKKISKKSKNITEKPLTVFLWFCFYAGLAGFILFGAVNFGAFKDRLGWFYYNDYLGEPVPSKLPPLPNVNKNDQLSVPGSIPIITSTSQIEGLKIEKLSLEAPIIWNVDEQDILENLKNGVVHYKGSSMPGDGGNVFITGHSSNYFWIKSDYNQVFALLDKLDKTDRISISYNNKIYTYEVVEKKVVNPSQVEVLNATKNEVLTLMTCWPVGTSLNRLIVQAELLFTSAN